ncbi:potassium channel family protein [Rhodococcus coprophilus]|uniref:Ion transporter n=1 Tax=Rhodococcus coprophilus TaxID=38310 RepID=A0A2X4UM76_9NOCA|nr:potassium channel family protein [Rhodococcus coprophilus]MBM7459582.1 hypothetical protein [Rhodococcus coprophilus]SQI36708.1 ion transporter [Rhodococcus coprophilus]
MTDRAALGGRATRRLLLSAAARPLSTTVVLLVVYFLAPLDGVGNLSAVFMLVAGVLVVVAVAVWQIRKVMGSQYPAVRAVEAAAATVAVYLVGYSTLYYVISGTDELGFSEVLSRVDALYFSLTVFATVGFGDIVATTDATRAVVSVQIVGNLILLAVGIRVLTGVVQWRRRQRENPPVPPSGG